MITAYVLYHSNCMLESYGLLFGLSFLIHIESHTIYANNKKFSKIYSYCTTCTTCSRPVCEYQSEYI